MQTAPATTDPLYRALRSAQADPDLAHAAVGAVLDLAGQNAITEVRSDIDGLRSELNAHIAGVHADLKAHIAGGRSELKTDIAAARSGLKADIGDVTAGLKTLEARLNDALRGQHQLNQILVGVFAAAVFGSLALQGYSIFFR